MTRPADLPPACYPSPNATLAERGYCAYLQATGGLNVRGETCPTWSDLPPRVQEAWGAAAAAVIGAMDCSAAGESDCSGLGPNPPIAS